MINLQFRVQHVVLLLLKLILIDGSIDVRNITKKLSRHISQTLKLKGLFLTHFPVSHTSVSLTEYC